MKGAAAIGGIEYTLAVDPGARACGFAVFYGKTLVKCGLVRTRAKTTAGQAMDFETLFHRHIQKHPTLIIERPEVYNQRNQKGDPNDLIGLGLIGGVVAGAVQPKALVLTLPKEWKGQTPKDIHHARIEAKLSPDEEARVSCAVAYGAPDTVPASLLHNVYDSIGIGLWYLKR